MAWIDFRALAEEQSDHAIAGEDLFLDHVHPTIEGNRLLALSILDQLAQEKVVRFERRWNDATIERVTEAVESRLDRQAHGIGHLPAPDRGGRRPQVLDPRVGARTDKHLVRANIRYRPTVSCCGMTPARTKSS